VIISLDLQLATPFNRPPKCDVLIPRDLPFPGSIWQLPVLFTFKSYDRVATSTVSTLSLY